MNFVTKVRAAAQGEIASVGEISRSNFFYFSRHVTRCGKQRREFRAPFLGLGWFAMRLF
jgi:hypothetical protein